MTVNAQKYRTIANEIHGWIALGDLQPGDPVLSEREISQRWGVSRPTATRALSELHHRGVLVRRPGKRSTVREAVPLLVDRERVVAEAERLVEDRKLTRGGLARLMKVIDG